MPLISSPRVWRSAICAAVVSLVVPRVRADDMPVDRIARAFRDPASKHVLVIAHRGGWRHAREYQAPENSLPNIDKAVRLGYDVFETDVSRTKDGRLILMHDPSVHTTTNGQGKVRDLTFAEMRKLRLKYRGKKEVTKELVPTFREALQRGRGRILFKVDLKFSLDHLPQVLDEILDERMLDYVMIRVNSRGSSMRKVKDVLARSPKYRKALILFRCKTPEDVKQVIADFHPPVIEIQGADLALTDDFRAMGKLIQAAGARVEAHASEDPQDWPEQIKIGIRAFHTKSPRKMLEWLRERKLHW